MKKIKKTILSLIVFTLCFYSKSVYSQQVIQNEVPKAEIAVLSRVQQDGKILLRWGITTPLGWRKLNKYGYQLKRYTITRNDNILAVPEEKNLGIFKPKPLNEWRDVIETNDNAAVMAQSLYGENFNIEGEDSLSAIINLSEEQQQRFTWAFYVADQDFEVAQLAGLGYVDYDISPNEMYAYKLVSLVPQEEVLIKEGITYTGIKDYTDLPTPLDLVAIFKENQVMLSWNYDINKETYNSYFVERSEDGSNFNPLHKLPLTSLNNGDKTSPKRMFYLDSILTEKKYFYRIKGRTPFGEPGPVSETVSGKGIKLLEYVPHITTKNYLDGKSIILGWQFLEEGNELIKGFRINRSDKVDGIYKTVIKDIVPSKREIQFNNMLATNYMTITALGKNGSNRTSLPVLIQPVDSIPPVKPIDLEGKVDSLGVVTLKWKANIEEDMLGYRLFRGNNKKEEYSQITVSPHQATTYYDSIDIKNLNAKVFYQIIAVDQRFNMSKPSDILALKKPDFIKPTQPIFKSYEIKDNKVHLVWTNSSSEDVVKHEIYRKSQENENWKLFYEIPKNNEILKVTDEWIDEDIIEKEQYSYTIIAIDDSNLESDPAPPVSVKIPKTALQESVKRFGAYIDKKNNYIELFWKPYTAKNVSEIAIYKGVKDKPISLLKNVLPNIKRIIDTKIKPNNEYVYLIRAIFNDGSISKTEKIVMKF